MIPSWHAVFAVAMELVRVGAGEGVEESHRVLKWAQDDAKSWLLSAPVVLVTTADRPSQPRR